VQSISFILIRVICLDNFVEEAIFKSLISLEYN